MNPGKRTTEFASLLLYALVIVANGTQYVTVTGDEMQVFGGVVAAYVLGRSYVKAKAEKLAA